MSGTLSQEAEASVTGPGIYSKVKAVCRVCPDTAHLSITLWVMARNQRGSPLELKKPYHLPAIQGLNNLTAYDASGPLVTLRAHGHDAVLFRPGKVIAPNNGEYEWWVSFECPGAFKRQENNIVGPFTIAVEHLFNDVEVSLHEFDYLFVFPKPKPRRSWPFRNIYVVPVADKNVRIFTKVRWKETHCRLNFTLRYKEKVRLFFASRYEFSSAIALGLTALLAAGVAEAGPPALAWLLRKWFG